MEDAKWEKTFAVIRPLLSNNGGGSVIMGSGSLINFIIKNGPVGLSTNTPQNFVCVDSGSLNNSFINISGTNATSAKIIKDIFYKAVDAIPAKPEPPVGFTGSVPDDNTNIKTTPPCTGTVPNDKMNIKSDQVSWIEVSHLHAQACSETSMSKTEAETYTQAEMQNNEEHDADMEEFMVLEMSTTKSAD